MITIHSEKKWILTLASCLAALFLATSANACTTVTETDICKQNAQLAERTCVTQVAKQGIDPVMCDKVYKLKVNDCDAARCK